MLSDTASTVHDEQQEAEGRTASWQIGQTLLLTSDADMAPRDLSPICGDGMMK